MFERRLLQEVPEVKKSLRLQVFYQWLALLMNVLLMGLLASLFQAYFYGRLARLAPWAVLVLAGGVWGRFYFTRQAARMSGRSARVAKRKLRDRLLDQLMRLGGIEAQDRLGSAELIQVSVEGIDQLELYFSAYLPQLFFAVLAPLTLFFMLCWIHWSSALVLLICVPLIPLTLALVQGFAKRRLKHYWTRYVSLGQQFLENLQGLTTLKVLEADGRRHEQMNDQAEGFRKATMQVLFMQLNSILVMDVLAYGGAALGMILALRAYAKGQVPLTGALLIFLLSAEFFLPMRQLGSFFHVALNGVTAAKRLFKFLDAPIPVQGCVRLESVETITVKDLCFSYPAIEGREEEAIFDQLNWSVQAGQFVAIVGESGSGKSTLARLLCDQLTGYTGRIEWNGIEQRELDRQSLHQAVTYVGTDSPVFQGTVADLLRMAQPDATDEALWAVLNQVGLTQRLQADQGLETLILEGGSNFSGGQRQRLALARALLHDSSVYIFDEVTAQVDVDTEAKMMQVISQLAGSKTVILITHRLAHTQFADRVDCFEAGKRVESGTPAELLAQKGVYDRLWQTQKELEAWIQ